MQSRWLVLAEKGSAMFGEYIRTRDRRIADLIIVESLASSVIEPFDTIGGLIIPLSPGHEKRACRGIESYLNFKLLEYEATENQPNPKPVIPTVLCSFLPDDVFRTVLNDRLANIAGDSAFLCITHARLPFVELSLWDYVRLALDGAHSFASPQEGVLYRYAMKLITSSYKPTH
jgi:hypothetical protein